MKPVQHVYTTAARSTAALAGSTSTTLTPLIITPTEWTLYKDFQIRLKLQRAKDTFWCVVLLAGPADLVTAAAGENWNANATYEEFKDIIWLQRKLFTNDVGDQVAKFFDLATNTSRKLSANDKIELIIYCLDLSTAASDYFVTYNCEYNLAVY